MKTINICFLKQGLLEANVPANIKGDELTEYCENLINEASDEQLDAAMADTDPVWDGTYRYGKYDADSFLIGKIEDGETFKTIFQTKTWEYLGDESAIESLEAENKAMGEFLEKQLGFSRDDVSDIANGTQQLYAVHAVCNNELQSYKTYTKIEEAHAAYVKLCEKWYLCEAGKIGNAVEYYDSYYGSPEYHDACDNAHVVWEVLNV